jgi:tRNA G18 (ribose-2'-O)-methylase SpoU
MGKKNNTISEKKWQILNTSKKIRIFKDNFLEIEKTLATNSVVQDLTELYHNFSLLKSETDTVLKKLYDVYNNLPFPSSMERCNRSILAYLYDKLREIFNDEIIAQKDFHFLPEINIIKQDKVKDSAKLPIILILDNLRSAFNVGSIIRTAECLNICQIYFCGYTPLPDNQKVINTSMGTEKMVQWSYYPNTSEAITKAKAIGYTVYALETVKNGQSIYDENYLEKTAIVVGNEALGIHDEIIKLCDKSLIIPISGWKNSLNVATACAVCCFEVYRKSTENYCQKNADYNKESSVKCQLNSQNK